MYYIIASLTDKKMYGNNVGFRILDTETKKTKDIEEAVLISAINSGYIKIQNASVNNNGLVGTNGLLGRYARVKIGEAYKYCPIVVLKQLRLANNLLVGYKVANNKGEIKTYSVKNLVEYAELHNVANGYIRDLGHKKIISSINGEYPVEEVSINKKNIEDGVDTQYTIIKRNELEDWDGGIFIIPKHITELERGWLGYRHRNEATIDMRLAENIKSIGVWGGYQVCGISKLIVSKYVEEIEEKAFRRNTTLESLELDEAVNLKIIQKQTFEYCNSINNLNIPKNVQVIKESAFGNCTSLSKVVFLSDGVLKDIGVGAFRSCGIVDLILPEGLINIGAQAFDGNSSLKLIKLPKSLESIGEGAFEGILGRYTFVVYKGTVGEHHCIQNGYNYKSFNSVKDMELGVSDLIKDADNMLNKLAILDQDTYSIFNKEKIDKRDVRDYYNILRGVEYLLDNRENTDIDTSLFSKNTTDKTKLINIIKQNIIYKYNMANRDGGTFNRLCNYYMRASKDITEKHSWEAIYDAIKIIRNTNHYLDTSLHVANDKYELILLNIPTTKCVFVVIRTNSDISYAGIMERKIRGSISPTSGSNCDGLEFLCKVGDVYTEKGVSISGTFIVKEVLKEFKSALNYFNTIDLVYCDVDKGVTVEYRPSCDKVIAFKNLNNTDSKVVMVKKISELSDSERAKIYSQYKTQETYDTINLIFKGGSKFERRIRK